MLHDSSKRRISPVINGVSQSVVQTREVARSIRGFRGCGLPAPCLPLAATLEHVEELLRFCVILVDDSILHFLDFLLYDRHLIGKEGVELCFAVFKCCCFDL